MALAASALQPIRAAGDAFRAGVYRQIDPRTNRPFVNLRTHRPFGVRSQVDLVRARDGTLAFAITAWRLNLNSGFVKGSLGRPSGALANWTSTATGTRCRLHFRTFGKHLEVTQDLDFGDCGFGNGVTASGLYAQVPGVTSLRDMRAGP
ncbi:MAG: hypothetical protein ACREM2_08040 [Vulcanimicrobiaceae bacterium]